MSHEQSETVQDEKTGKWVNVYGRNTRKSGQRLPDSGEYDSVEEAVQAAKKRSEDYDPHKPKRRSVLTGPEGGGPSPVKQRSLK